MYRNLFNFFRKRTKNKSLIFLFFNLSTAAYFLAYLLNKLTFKTL